MRYIIDRWMGGVIGRWRGDRYIASAEGKGYAPLYICDSDIAIKRHSDEFCDKREKKWKCGVLR